MNSRHACYASIFLLITSIYCCAQQPALKADAFSPLRFLAGTWRSTSSGEPGEGTGERTYEFVFKDRFLRVQNRSVYPPQVKNEKGEVHEDFGVFSYDKARKKLVLRQFHGEGFVNTYIQDDSESPKVLIFTTESIENIAPGWRARESYTIVSNDEFIERFELAEPGQEFKPYAQSHLKRVKSETKK